MGKPHTHTQTQNNLNHSIPIIEGKSKGKLLGDRKSVV